MSKLSLAILVTLFVAGSAQAKTPAAPTASTFANCAQLRMTAFNGLDSQARACCGHATHCPRLLAITPLPRTHHELRT